MKPTNRWLRMAEIYKRFARPNAQICDFSDKAAEAMFDFESQGIGDLRLNLFNKMDDGKFNGFAIGKHWMDVTISMWKEEMRARLLFIDELLEDFPEWWIKKIFAECYDEDWKFHYSWLSI